MFVVKNKLGPSTTHGIGVFAEEDIAAGQLVWAFHPAVDLAYPAPEWRRLLAEIHPAARENVERYAYKSNNTYYVCIDNAQFMNHSNAPNIVNDPVEDRMYARRAIKKGEELFCDYREYSDPDDPHLAKVAQNSV